MSYSVNTYQHLQGSSPFSFQPQQPIQNVESDKKGSTYAIVGIVIFFLCIITGTIIYFIFFNGDSSSDDEDGTVGSAEEIEKRYTLTNVDGDCYRIDTDSTPAVLAGPSACSGTTGTWYFRTVDDLSTVWFGSEAEGFDFCIVQPNNDLDTVLGSVSENSCKKVLISGTTIQGTTESDVSLCVSEIDGLFTWSSTTCSDFILD